MRVLIVAALFALPAAAQEIVHQPPSLTKGMDLAIRARVTGAEGLRILGYLNWRKAGEADYRPAMDMLVSGDQLSATIAAAQIGDSEVQYYIQAYIGEDQRAVPSRGTADEPLSVKPVARPRPVAGLDSKPPPEVRKRDLTLPFVALGAAAVTAGVATVFGLQARSAANDVAAANTQTQYVASKDKADSAASRANMAWAGAGVLAVVSAALFYVKF